MEYYFGSQTKAYRDGITFLCDVPERVQGYSFCLSTAGYVAYSSNKDGLHNKFLHRVLMNAQPGQIIDHINGNKLDNRLCNLRFVNLTENAQNSKKRTDNTSGAKGIYWDKRDEKWVARISVNGKRLYIGYFTSIDDAERAVRKAREELHGAFARHE